MKMDVYWALWCEFHLTASKRPEYPIRLAMIALTLAIALHHFLQHDSLRDRQLRDTGYEASSRSPVSSLVEANLTILKR
jgi:hypothetical protein